MAGDSAMTVFRGPTIQLDQAWTYVDQRCLVDIDIKTRLFDVSLKCQVAARDRFTFSVPAGPNRQYLHYRCPDY